MQVGQLSKWVPQRPNTLPSNIEVNPREECKALLIGKEAKLEEKPTTEDLKKKKAQEEIESTLLHASVVVKDPEVQHPLKLQEETKDEKLTQFLKIFKKLQINISFAEVLEKMPPYMACLKSVLSEKKALKEDETVVLTKKCSALVQKKLPQKIPDLGSFLIPCIIGTITFEKALCDLRSSINLMPLSLMKNLGILKVQSIRISLEIADKSLKRAYGLVENILVMVEDLYLPADFVILDTGEEIDDPIILGRPFLITGRALIDAERGNLVLRQWEDYILFKIFKPPPLSYKGGTGIQSSELKPSHLVESHTVLPDIKPKFGVRHLPPTKDGEGPKKKVPKGGRNKKIPIEDFSPGMRVVFTQSPVIPHIVNRILSLKHVEVIYESTEKKFTMRGEDLRPYDPPP
nr:uncharacterized protein LOC112721399 [Arachis hypogaea]